MEIEDNNKINNNFHVEINPFGNSIGLSDLNEDSNMNYLNNEYIILRFSIFIINTRIINPQLYHHHHRVLHQKIYHISPLELSYYQHHLLHHLLL